MGIYIAAGLLAGIALILAVILWNYQRQVKDICRQIRFLKEHDSNMLITKELDGGGIGELAALLNEFLMERKEEHRSYAKKEQLIADTYTNLSHDIRTPLTSLDGYLQLLETAGNEQDRRRYLSVIQSRIDSLKEMLEELFTYTKLQNESYELKLERINLNQILKDTVFSYFDDWKERGIQPEFDITEQPLWALGNSKAFKRVVQNIIKNALEHGKEKISISLHKEGEEAVIIFANEAEGTDMTDPEKVFDRFYKGDEARSKNSSGLGLSIAKGFITKMGAQIGAEFEDGLFSVTVRFRVTD